MLQRDAGRVLKKANISRPDVLMAAGAFFGATRLQLRSGDFTVSAVTHVNARTVPMHAHAHAFFSMLISGHYREWFGQMLHDGSAYRSLREIAADLDLHPVHVSRAFKRHKGMSVSQYMRELRLQRTARGLLESREPLAAVAQDNGFADQSHMTRDFIRATHWSPSKLRCECERLRCNAELRSGRGAGADRLAEADRERFQDG